MTARLEDRPGQVETNLQRNKGFSPKDLFNLYNMAPIGYCTLDEKGLILEANLAACALLGTTRGELAGRPIFGFIGSENQDIYGRFHEQLLETGKSQDCELRMRKKDESAFRARLTAATARAEGGALLILLVLSDITEQKRAETALLESERRLRLFVEHAPAALAMFDREMRYLSASSRWSSDYGLGNRDLTGLSHYEIFPEIPERWKKAHSRGLAGEVLRAEADRYERADGSIQWIGWEIRPWHDASGDIGGIVIFTEDITGRMKAEQALRENKKDFDRAQEVGSIGSWRLDVRRNILSWSDENYRIFGIPNGMALSYETFIFCVHPDDRAHVDTQWQAALRGEPYDFEHRIMVDGRVKWVREKAFLEVDKNGEVAGGFGIAQDITQRKLAEQALRKNERTVRALIDSADESIWLFGLDGEILAANETAARRRGMTVEEVVGKKWQDIIPANPGISRAERIAEIIRTGSPLFFQDMCDGIPFDHSAYPVRDEGGTISAVAFFSRDVTERVRTEAELRTRNEDLETFNNAAVGRELRMIELKKEINALCAGAGLPWRYDLDFTEDPQ